MFKKLKLAFDLARLKKVQSDIDNASVKLSNARNEMLQVAKEHLNTDVSKVTADWIKEKYDEAAEILEMVKPYPEDMGFAELVAIYYDFVKKLEDEIKNRGLNIKLGLAEKYKEDIFKQGLYL